MNIDLKNLEERTRTLENQLREITKNVNYFMNIGDEESLTSIALKNRQVAESLLNILSQEEQEILGVTLKAVIEGERNIALAQELLADISFEKQAIVDAEDFLTTIIREGEYENLLPALKVIVYVIMIRNFRQFKYILNRDIENVTKEGITVTGIRIDERVVSPTDELNSRFIETKNGIQKTLQEISHK